jgi:uncharacterized protein YwgA
MGKGIALGFKKRYPKYYREYARRCKQGKVKLGFPYLYRTLEPPWILSFPTKDHWRSMTKLTDIVQGMEWLLEHYKKWGIESIAVPPLGSGNGQLEWRVVGSTLHRYLKQMDIPVELYAPYGIPSTELEPEFLEGPVRPLDYFAMPDPEWIKPGWVALVEILRNIQDQRYRRPVGRTIFQKIAYLATEEGIPTELDFVRRAFGPHSGDAMKVMTRLLNNGLIEERRKGKLLEVIPGPTYDEARQAYAGYLAKWESKINRIADLVMRTQMNTKTAEIVASIIYAARRLEEIESGPPKEVEVFNAVMEWKRNRRPPIDESKVAYMLRFLAGLHWIDVVPSEDLRIPETSVQAY